jgi:hypothetical protein
MNQTISFNEIITTVTKALFALGVPPGVDSETGKNIAWLEAHNFPGVKILAREINKIDVLGEWPDFIVSEVDDVVTIDSSIPSALIFSQTGLDIAATGKVLHIKACSAPLILFAEAVRRASELESYKLNWAIDGLIVNADCSHKHHSLSGDHNGFSVARYVTVQKIKSAIPNDTLTANQVYQKYLAEGVMVDKSSWEIILKVAKKSLVTSTSQSRASAGAEVDDSN